ncbi:hypothetical protein LTR02_014145 [Friedmanniomyces endolithicus]|nr:hypothetical protein LTR94_016717 [Friedmanniomyces endolithicus]KAK0782994.1 hypothetical protein LTR59_011923 [Friedmanniomyces endolithicus]KAK0814104.1 hypothetical protein LTR38_002879 [Friedmanniomyces endolithicus]KAK0820587.1 hypothetical protein LTR75_001465 [Friedmanniomyces endolithicus]KAK0851252.1 hypothetical protein LTS02_012870 [Friedmanniomyces endolithicus]
MVVVGSNTRNGKVILSDRNPDKLRLEREEKKRVAKLEHVRLIRFYKSQPNYTNRELAESAFETPVIQRDRYAFGEKLGVRISHPKNVVFAATKKLLAEFNRTDLHRQLDPLAVEALSDLPTTCHARETESAVFLLGRVQTFVKLQLKLVREFDAPGAAMIVMVRVGSQRHSLRAWLETLPKHRMPNIERLALDLQHQQWRRSGHPFRFERLPAEIRSRILLFAVGPYVEPRHPHKLFMRDGCLVTRKEFDLVGKSIPSKADNEWCIDTQHKQLDRINLGLLAINKATREECISVLRMDTTKRYQDLSLVNEIPRFVPAPCLTWIRRLELALTHIDLIQLFRCEIKPFGDYFRGLPLLLTTTASVLSKAILPLLKHLELTFVSTIEPTYSPWQIVDGRYPSQIDPARLTCQKVLVDMIMCFVPEWVEHIPTIVLGGFIKTATRVKWEHVLNSKTPRRFDGFIESEKQAVRSLPDSDLPKAPKPHPIAQAAAKYFFDYDDTFKVEVKEERRPEVEERGVERQVWMTVKSR